ncbi:hypothetical protein V8G54_015680, partial [Vigna mungo]
MLIFYIIPQSLFEALKGLENVVEIVPREIIQVDLVFRRLLLQFSTKLLHQFYGFIHHKQSVRSRRTTQVCNCYAFRSHSSVEPAHRFLSHNSCQTNCLLLNQGVACVTCFSGASIHVQYLCYFHSSQ